jgi:hypothetical protein
MQTNQKAKRPGGHVRQRAAKNNVKPPPKLWISVVWSGTASARSSGGFESWVGTSKAMALEQAMAAKHRWDNPRPYNLPYRVLVGQLTEEAKVPMRYELGPVGMIEDD